VDRVGDRAAVAGAAGVILPGRGAARDNPGVPDLPSFVELAASPDPRLDWLALALAGELRPVDAAAALAALDGLGAELAEAVVATDGAPAAEADACAAILGGRNGFVGDREQYDDPANSMLDLVLARRRGLPIVLSVVYVEAGRRAGVPLAGVGLPGHFVVGHFGADPPLLLDPFAGGRRLETAAPEALVRPWRPHEIAMRMLNNLVGSYQRRGDLGAAIRAATMRLRLPADDERQHALRAELRAMRARLN
jgi:regulator of sirC expression with transglutaminase-like and TPR domain